MLLFLFEIKIEILDYFYKEKTSVDEKTTNAEEGDDGGEQTSNLRDEGLEIFGDSIMFF